MTSVTTSQSEKILEYMNNHDCITSLDAIREIGCLRLSARISDLRKKGHFIISQNVIVRNRDGKNVRVTAYSLASEDMLYE